MKNSKMMLRQAAERDTSGFVAIKWVSPETDGNGQPLAERLPQASTAKFLLLGGFAAAGKPYRTIKQLTAADGGKEWLSLDIYGREVLCLKERFPCFDSYDYLYEHRYYRWFFLRHDGKLVQVYYADEGKTVEVTTDVTKLRDWQWDIMKTVWDCE